MDSFKISNILAPVDFSETGLLALEHAVFMARLFKAKLYLLYVIEQPDFPFSPEDTILMFTLPDNKELEQLASKKMSELATKIRRGATIDLVTKVAQGKVISEVVKAAEEFNISLIIMGTHGAKGFDEYFAGSNAQKASTLAPCPVLTVQKRANKIGFNKIVMPIDNSLHSRQKVDTVINIAQRYASEVHILGLYDIGNEREEPILNIKLKTVKNAMRKAGVSYVLNTMECRNLAVATLDYANRIEADLIAIMTEHESNLTGIFLGPFSKQIINHSIIPVLSIKPQEGIYEYVNFGGVENPFVEL